MALPKTTMQPVRVEPTAADDAAASALLRRAHEKSIRTPLPDVVSWMQGLLGEKLVSIVVGIEDPQAVGKWARKRKVDRQRRAIGADDKGRRGDRLKWNVNAGDEVLLSERDDAETQLRVAYEVALLLTMGDSVDTARAWFLGMNPILGDRAPVAVLREESQGGERVMQAARAFLAHA